jgi:hypothetical protein
MRVVRESRCFSLFANFGIAPGEFIGEKLFAA